MSGTLQPHEIAVGHSGLVSPDVLVFDPRNPRFVPANAPENADVVTVLKNLYAEAELRELLQSIGANGYIGIEPMIVMLEDKRLVVLEGNRRLAAIICLRDPGLAASAQISVPNITPEAKASLEAINVHRVAQREDAQEIIGFKHINGPRPWDAFAKARFAASWLEREEAKGSTGLTLREIADRMGDQHNTLRRMVTASRVLDQAEREDIWNPENRTTRRLSFSHLYTGLSYREVTSYLGMDVQNLNEDPSTTPVPNDRSKELRNLLSWLYGDKREDEDTVIVTQAKSLRRLGKVLGQRAATDHLVTSRDLDRAYVTAQPPAKLFMDNLYLAHDRLTDCVSNLDGYESRDQTEVRDLTFKIQKKIRTVRLTIEASSDGEDDE